MSGCRAGTTRYGAQYHVLEMERLDAPSELSLVLVVPSLNDAFEHEVRRMCWTHASIGDGYGRVDGAVYTVHVVATDEVAEAEADEFLQIFSHHREVTRTATWWWQQWAARATDMQDLTNLEGYDEMRKKFLGSVTPEELTREQRLLLAPDELLARLSDEELRALSPEVQETIRKRIGRSGK